MATATLQFTISGTNSSGEPKQLTSSGQIQCTQLSSGTQQIGATYEPLATPVAGCTAVILFNKSDTDVSVQMDLGGSAPGKRYHALNLIAGGILVVPNVLADGKPVRWQSLNARAASGSADIDYCIIR